MSGSIGEQGVELAFAIEGVQVVAAANVGVADPDLRYRHAAAGLLDQRLARFPVAADVDLFKSDTLLAQQPLAIRGWCR